MTSERVARVVEMLRLTPGVDGAGSELSSWEEIYLGTLAVLRGVPAADRADFWAGVSAEYLPSMVRTTIERPLNQDNLKEVEGFVNWITWMPINTTYSGRFIREQGAQAIAYHQLLLEVVYTFHNEIIAGENNRLHHLPKALLLRLNEGTNELISFYDGSSIPVAPISPTDQATLRRVAQAVFDSEAVSLSLLDRQRIAKLLDLVAKLGMVDLEEVRKVGLENPALVTWMGCQLKVEKRDEKAETPCVRLKKGKEMSACSRCMAVRYCSEEHQLLDWKLHKKICFKSSW